jgi:deoxyribose-phosphate aldolase
MEEGGRTRDETPGTSTGARAVTHVAAPPGMVSAPLAGPWSPDIASSDAALRKFLHGLPGVDQVGAESRAIALGTRSVKREAKMWALEQAIAMIDLTTLEGADTPGKIAAMCAKARRPDPSDPEVPPVAAVCVYPDLVGAAVGHLEGSPVAVASVATAFPSGRASMKVKLADVRDALDAGAQEVDMVIDRGAFLSGRYGLVYEEVRAVREAAGAALLKVILETGELDTYDNVQRAAWLAMLAGADFVKTSTGKVTPAATRPVALVLLAAARDFLHASGRRVGVKVAGGIRTAKEAVSYLVIARETAGEEWLTPTALRIGASTLLNDLLMQRTKQRTGAYSGRDYFTID